MNEISKTEKSGFRALVNFFCRKCVLEEDVIVGPGSKIGENSTVSSVTIGYNCTIGNNVSLRLEIQLLIAVSNPQNGF